MENGKLLEVKNVSVCYGKKCGIKSASFSLKKAEILGLIGADGAGKSSILHAIAGVVSFKGEIEFKGYVYHSPKEAEKIKEKISLMPQGLGLVLYDDLSVKEHFDFFRSLRGLKRDIEYETRLLKMAGLYEFQDRLAGNLSGGMRQKLSLILALLPRPELLILDEPTTGVDPISRAELWEIVNEMREKEGLSALISTAYMSEASKMDRIMLFDESEIIAKGTAEELIKSIKDYTYEGEIESEECFSFNKRTYCLKPLNLPKATPSLEGLFFINALKKGKKPIKIELPQVKLDVPEIILKGKCLTKIFGNFIADNCVDIELKKGEILGLLGANGAGKTTLIKMLLGLYPIDRGELYLLGRTIKSYKDRISLKEKIGYVSQKFALYKDMTIKENLYYFASMHKLSRSEANRKIEEYSTLLGFKEYLNEFPKNVPLGINQRFSVAAALLHEPVVLFLDEPTSGVDTIARAAFWKMLRKIKEQWKIGILITTHYMSEAEYCDRVVVLKRGVKILDEEVKRIHQMYPGKEFEEIFLEVYKRSVNET
ncbi:ATP-binding cassette domain-containing protein [Caminibacter sp.]